MTNETPDNDSLEGLDPETTKQLARISRDLANDPATRKDYLRLLKKQNPNQAIPELDLEAQMENFAKPHVERVTRLEQEILKRDLEKRIESQRQALRDQGYSADEVTAIEKMMVEKKIPSHETAADYFRLQRASAVPTTQPRGLPNTLPVDKKTIKEAGGIRRWSLTEAHKAADDIRTGRVKLH